MKQVDRRAQVQRYNAEYYEKNKETLASAKKERYENDPAYREQIKKRSKEYKDRRKQGEPVHRTIFRVVDGVNQQVYTTGMVGDMFGCTSQHICNLHKKGLLPDCTIEGKHRLYTQAQVDLIEDVLTGAKSKINSW